MKKFTNYPRPKIDPTLDDPDVFPIQSGVVEPEPAHKASRPQHRSEDEVKLYDLMITRGYGIGGRSIKYPLHRLSLGDVMYTPRAFTKRAIKYVEGYNKRHPDTHYSVRTMEHFVGIWRDL